VQITLTLCLPRDEQTVPAARRLVRACIAEAGVDDEVRGDIEVALSEACTNVLKHSGPGDEYDVKLDLDDRAVVIRVVDTGRGFDHDSLADARSDVSAERGRGIELMRALMDTLEFTSVPESGTVVHLEKELALSDASMFRRLAARRQAGA
jgi:serine/threonine-protein kinase RsbW